MATRTLRTPADPRTTARYGLSKPAATHRRPATCAEVDCRYMREGWKIVVREGTPQYDKVAHAVKLSGRNYTVEAHLYDYAPEVKTELAQQRLSVSEETAAAWLALQDKHFHSVFTFTAGQQCFRKHSVDLQRPALYLVRQGASAPIRHTRGSDWVDDFATHLDKIREQ